MKNNKTNPIKIVVMLVLLVLVVALFNPSKLGFLPENIRFMLEDFVAKYFANAAISSINLQTIGAAVLTIAVTWLVAQIVKFIFGCFKCKKGRSETIHQLIGDLCKYVIYIVGWAIALGCFGIDTSAIFASIGVVGIVVGFGAQSLIEDVITGLFIIFEGEFEVGDIISVDGFRGEVKSIGLRTVSIMDVGGNIRVVNNSEISSLINLSEVKSVAVVNVPLSYEDSLEAAEKAIQEALANIPSNHPEIFTEAPIYKGVNALVETHVELLVIASVKEEHVYDAERIIKREIKLAYEKAGLQTPCAA